MPTASREIVVSNKLGLHARPAMQFVDVANQFRSKVSVHKGGEEPADADGDDAPTAVEKLAELFINKFGEEE